MATHLVEIPSKIKLQTVSPNNECLLLIQTDIKWENMLLFHKYYRVHHATFRNFNTNVWATIPIENEVDFLLISSFFFPFSLLSPTFKNYHHDHGYENMFNITSWWLYSKLNLTIYGLLVNKFPISIIILIWFRKSYLLFHCTKQFLAIFCLWKHKIHLS